MLSVSNIMIEPNEIRQDNAYDDTCKQPDVALPDNVF
jgi:hypothetical protein